MDGLISSLRQALGDTLFYYAVSPAVKILVLLFLGILPLITYLVLAERKILGYMQARLGPNRVGPWGLLQPIADVMKLLVKGDNIPTQEVKWAFILTPCLVVGPAIIIFAVIPIGPPRRFGGGRLWPSPVRVLGTCGRGWPQSDRPAGSRDALQGERCSRSPAP